MSQNQGVRVGDYLYVKCANFHSLITEIIMCALQKDIVKEFLIR